jgi:2-polyprenyl-6-hydroxyphenyl methylase/3-demethylubiquinone-9 3-methyltransferase
MTRAQRAFDATRAWVRDSRAVRPLLEPFWIAALVMRREYQKARLRIANFRAGGGWRPVQLTPDWLRAWVHQRPRLRGVIQRALAPVRRGLVLARRLLNRSIGDLYALRKRAALARMRTDATLYILRNERRAIDWAYGRTGGGISRRLAGRVALLAADVYYGRAFDKFARAGRAPLLPRAAFDPNHAMLVVSTLGPGGAERQVVTSLLELRRTTQLRLTVACIFLDEEWQRFFLSQVSAAGIEVVVLPRLPPDARPFDPALQARFDEMFAALPPNLGDIRDYAALLLRHRPGILHLWMDETSCKGGLAALAVGVPKIVMSARSVAPHHFGFYHEYLFAAFRTILRRGGTYLLNNSRAGATDYAKWLGLNPGRIRVIHNGFHFEELPDADGRMRLRRAFRASLGWTDDAPVLGTILRFTEEKRPDLWVDTAIMLAGRSPQMRFLLVGDGPMRKALEERVAAAGFTGRFVFAGYRRDTIDAICAMDVFLLTSRKEGLPNVLVEAQALGVPVVAVDAGGAAETLAPGKSGLLVHGNEVAEVSAAVERLIGDPALRAGFGVAAIAHVRKAFAVDTMVKATLDVYRAGQDQGGKVVMSAGQYAKATAEEMRFAFGKNWKDYIEKRLSDERVETSRLRMLEFLGMKDLAGRSFLDIGCGSGLHSLAAYRSGARQIVGFDYDPNSVLATKVCHQFAGSPGNWRFEQGSVLDEAFMQRLERADIVYSWGVLHHTGDVWGAIRNAADRVAPGGLFYIALYSADVQHPPRTAEFWLDVKRQYLKASWLGKRRWEWWYIWNCMVDRKVYRLPEVVQRLYSHKKDRGMDLMTDIRDWLGGWPMEFVHDAEAVKFCKGLGFKLEKIDTGKANTEFLFRRVD